MPNLDIKLYHRWVCAGKQYLQGSVLPAAGTRAPQIKGTARFVHCYEWPNREGEAWCRGEREENCWNQEGGRQGAWLQMQIHEKWKHIEVIVKLLLVSE